MDRGGRRVLEDSIAGLKGIIASLKEIYRGEYIRLNSFKGFFSAFIASSR